MKRFISLLLSVAILLTVSVPALAAEQSVNPDELYATMIPEVTNMTREEVDNLPEEQIDRYFEQAFDNKVSAEDYSYSEKLSAVEAVALVGKFEQATEQYGIATRATTSTKSNLSSYTGSKGVAWVRDTQNLRFPLAKPSPAHSLWKLIISPIIKQFPSMHLVLISISLPV